MQNKGAIWFFTILLTIACLYQISFTWVANQVENEAKEIATAKADSLQAAEGLEIAQRDSAMQSFESEYLLNAGGKEVYPVLGYNYNYVKRNQINLGLDLQGGMNVTLEVSVVDLVKAMAGSNAEKEIFISTLQRAKELKRESDLGFVQLFNQAWNELNGDTPMATVFSTLSNKDIIASDASNEEIIAVIETEAQDAIKRTEQVLRKRVDNLGVVQPKIQRLANSGRIIVELPGVKDKSRVRKILQGTAKLEFWDAYENAEVFNGLSQANEILRVTEKSKRAKDQEADDAIEELAAEDSVQTDTELSSSVDSAAADTSGSDELLTDLLGGADSTASDSSGLAESSLEEQRKNNPLFALLQPQYQQDQQGNVFPAPGPRIGFARAADTAQINAWFKRKDIRNVLAQSTPRVAFLWDAKPLEETEDVYSLYAVKKTRDGVAPLEGDKVTDARVGTDPLGNPTVNMTMNPTGAKIWRDMTREASKDPQNLRSIAVVLDGLVYSAPTVQGEIPGGNTEIAGRFTQQEASDLAGVLKAGKLPAPSHIIEEAVVGPSLGKESISSGLQSFMVALALILLYMIFYYNRAGIVADVALISNVFFVVGVLTSIKATLTLPGIAGIVLTIGMSVDANVLIYERIREELRAGKGLKMAIADGYKNAYSSIIDANITTMLTGIILFVFGTGPIQGFATTLIIGILTSLFSAIFVTRLLFEWNMASSSNISFATKATENVFANAAYKFVTKRKTFYVISGILLVISIGSLVSRGLDYGVDFKGGRTYTIRFEQPVEAEAVRTNLSSTFVDENGVRQEPEVKIFGSSNQVMVTTKFLIDDDADDVDARVEARLNEGLGSMGMSYEVMASQKVEPTIADDIKQSSVWAVVFSLIVIFLYILIRFKKYQYSVGAVIAMTHDVLITLGVFSLLWGVLPFSLEIDQAFIAAILTVVGYSINDTVVVFDRIREYLGIHKKTAYNDVVNKALNSTLSRTINTSLTTFFVLLMIFIFGGEVIRGFVFALMVGVVVGTYSSICVATPVMIDLQSKEQKDKRH